MEVLGENTYSRLSRSIGQMLFMGWDEPEVTPEIRRLVEEFHVGSIFQTAKNLKCERHFDVVVKHVRFRCPLLRPFTAAQHAARLVQELQTIAHNAKHSESNRVIRLVQQYASPEIAELYSLAMRGYSACGIVRVKGPDGAILGATVVCAPRSPMTSFIPILDSGEEDVGGIMAPLAYQKSNEFLVMQAVVLMGLRQNKAHGARKTVLVSVSGNPVHGREYKVADISYRS